MRATTLCFAAALLLLVATGVDARRRNPFSDPLPAARKRAFAGQEVGDCSSAQFRSDYNAVNKACNSPNVTGAFDNFTSVADANEAWNKLCDSECFSMTIALRTGEFGNCLSDSAIEFVMEIAVMCRKDTADNRCGAVLTETNQIACYVDPNDKKPAKTCAAIGQCSYKNGICFANATQSYLETVCGGGCITMMVAALASTSSSLAAGALLLQQQVCPAEADGNYCMAVLKNEVYDLTLAEFQQGIATASVKSICETPAKRRCVKRLYGGRLEEERRSAEEAFFSCVAGMYDGYIRDPKHYNVTKGYKQCQQFYFFVYSATAYVTAAELDQMCTKNAAGDYCVGLMGDYSAGNIVTDSTCLSYVDECFFNCKCSAKCVTQLEAAVTKFGCCLGTLQSIYGTVPDLSYIDVNDIPTLEFNPADYASSSIGGSGSGASGSGSGSSGSGSSGSGSSGFGSSSGSGSSGSGSSSSGSGSSSSGSGSSGSSSSGSSSSGSSSSGSSSGSGSSGSGSSSSSSGSSSSGSGSSSSGSGSSSSGSSSSGSSSSGSGSSGSGSSSSGSSSSGSGSSGSGSSSSGSGSGSSGSGFSGSSGSGESGSGFSNSGSGSSSSGGGSDVVEKLSFGLFRNFMVCKSSKVLAALDTPLRQLCPTPLAAPTVREMPIGLDYSALSGDAALKDRLISKLNSDIAVLFGLTAGDIKTSLSGGGAANRHMSTMAAPSTNVQMSMRSQSSADDAAAGNQFDDAQKNKSLVLPSTTRMVAKECKSCAPGGAASLQSGADLSAIPQPPTLAPTPIPGSHLTPAPSGLSSGTTSIRVMLAAVAALLLSLLHFA